MGNFRQTPVRVVTLGASGSPTDTARVWDNNCEEPLKRVSILLSSDGIALAAGNLRWEVFYGGRFVGTPFGSTSTHDGGVSQANGVIGGGVEVCEVIYDEDVLLPANKRIMVNSGSIMVQTNVGSTPIVLRLINDKAVPCTLYVTFTSETAGDKE